MQTGVRQQRAGVEYGTKPQRRMVSSSSHSLSQTAQPAYSYAVTSNSTPNPLVRIEEPAQLSTRGLGWLLDSRFYGRKNYLKEMDKLLSKLTVEDVNTALRKHW